MLDEASRAGDALNALLRAGELECALADAADPAWSELAAWTDAAADALVGGRRVEPLPTPAISCASVRASIPEGFAYYALHPLDYAAAARRAAPDATHVLVLGLRTIGTTLSAVVAATLRARGVVVRRHTARPAGHPFDRRVELDRGAHHDAGEIAARGGLALVADEGPGFSGSSFLAAADALAGAGFARERVVLIPSHAPDPDRLCAPRGPARWRALRTIVADPTRAVPRGSWREISAGEWRTALLGPGEAWPATWPAMERRKHLAHDGAILKFEGLGHFGDGAWSRAAALAELEIGPRAARLDDGFVRWERAAGRALSALDSPPLDCIARAIDARGRLALSGEPALSELEDATRDNVQALLGRDIDLALPLARPAIVDGRLAPHEWIAREDGVATKVDAVSHGDDHFLPGPCDVAWDLAGAIVEWQLDDAASAALVERYVRRSGDRDAGRRVAPWRVAYTAFRAAWLTMARDACAGSAEHRRLARAASHARRALELGIARLER